MQKTRAALGNVAFSHLFPSGNQSEDKPPPHLLIPVSGGKEAKKPEVCESQGACAGAWSGRVLGSTVLNGPSVEELAEITASGPPQKDEAHPVVLQEDLLIPWLSSQCSRGGTSYLGLCHNTQHQEPKTPLFFILLWQLSGCQTSGRPEDLRKLGGKCSAETPHTVFPLD